jgi:hypothetical protein
MGLGDLEKPAELWTMIVGKDGTEYKNMFKCNSIKEFEEAEPELSNKINSEFQKWYAATGKDAAEAQLAKSSKEGGGYPYKHTDGITYRLSKFNGQLQLTKIKPSSWGGKGGKSFTFMRTEAVRLGPVDVVNQTLQSQGPNDSWKITKVAGEAMKDMIFLLEKQGSYVPTMANTTESKKDVTKEASQEDTEE